MVHIKKKSLKKNQYLSWFRSWLEMSISNCKTAPTSSASGFLAPMPVLEKQGLFYLSVDCFDLAVSAIR